MNFRIIKALLRKDLALFTGNRFYMLITIAGLIMYIGVYFILPSTTDEKLSLAIYAPEIPPSFSQLSDQAGIDIQYYSNESSLKQDVSDHKFQAGIVLPDNITEAWTTGNKPLITVYYASDTAVEIRDAVVTLVKELSYQQTGQSLDFDTKQEILGPDMLGSQLTLRDRMRPLLAVFILLVEIMSLASLISTEIEQGTARALLTTPMRVSDLFMAKGIIGVGLALVQAILFMALVGGFSHQPAIVIVTLLLSSVMVVGIGFLLASIARDVTAVTSWGMLIFIILAIPGFGIIVPGLLSDWVKTIPSFYLTDTVNRVINYGAGWNDIGLNLIVLTGFTALVIWGGMVALRRRYL